MEAAPVSSPPKAIRPPVRSRPLAWPPGAVTSSQAERFRSEARKSVTLLGSAVGLFVLTILVSSALSYAGPWWGKWTAVAGTSVATGIAFLSVLRGLRALTRIRGAQATGAQLAGVIAGPVVFGSLMTWVGVVLSYLLTVGFSRGRQLRSLGRILQPPVREGNGWSALALGELPGSPDSAAIANQWRENGRTEHASVAAFARLTLDLIALGAPAKLVMDAQLDARDEVRHTELCFSLARALDGQELSPGPFPEAARARTLGGPRVLALTQLAVDSLVDGALHEGLSAQVIAQLAKRCEVPAIRAVLKELAADEGRHAAHGWDVVEWCLAEGGTPVARALEGATLALPPTLDSERGERASSGAWERFGIHGHALEARAYQRMREALIRRVWGRTGALGRTPAVAA